MKGFWKYALAALLLSPGIDAMCAAQEQPMQPSGPLIVETDEPADPTPLEVELKGGWFRKADGTLILKREEGSHAVKTVTAGVDYGEESWTAGFFLDTELSGEERKRLRLYAQRAFGDRARGFAEWSEQLQDTSFTLNAGLEYSVFGADKWMLSRRVDGEAGNFQVQDTLGLTLPLPVLGLESVEFTTIRTDQLEQLRGELMTHWRPNIEVGASVGSQKPSGTGPDAVWSAPEVRGNLRYRW